jgi:DNA-binding transcriptional regulator LsrR (DeoR family)
MSCKEWTGYRDADGYGTVRHEGKKRKAHRVAYVEAHGLTHGAQGLTQDAIARSVGMSQAHVSNILNGKVRASK